MKNVFLKKLFLRLVVFLVPLILFSCSSLTTLNYRTLEGYDQKKLSNGENININLRKIIPLDSKCHLSIILKVEQVDSCFVIQDEDGVYGFDANGRFLCQYGHKGHGRKEYISVYSFFVDENKDINLLDSYTGKIMTFNLKGEYLSEKRLKTGMLSIVNDICKLPNRNLLFYSNDVFNDQNCIYGTFDLNKLKEKELVRIPLRTQNVGMPIGKHPFSIFKGTLRYVVPFENKIYTFDSDNTLMLNTKQVLLDEDHLAKINDFGMAAYMRCMHEKKFLGFTDIFETEKYILLSFLNMEYVLVDKSNNRCQKYDYYIYGSYSRTPLIGIIATHENNYIGILDSISTLGTELIAGPNHSLNEAIRKVRETGVPALLIYTIN